MEDQPKSTGEEREGVVDRRSFLTRRVPACAAACAGFCSLPDLAGLARSPDQQEPHKFDEPLEQRMSARQSIAKDYQNFVGFVRTLQGEMDEAELLRLLRLYSAEVGRQAGQAQLQNSPDNSFQSFVATFRPPRYARSLTHEVVVDTEKVFELRVTECVWATALRDLGMDGELGHAAICNMDYHWPPAFNPDFKMERDRTLMQGHDHCNHRYIDTA